MLKKTLTLAGLTLSLSVNASVVTHGFLSSYDDGSSNLIVDSLNNVEYLRLDVLADLTYAQTLAVLDTQDGGGWTIADGAAAVAFSAALLGGTTGCEHNGADVVVGHCGLAAGWTDGDFGDNNTSSVDDAWFIDSMGEADYIFIGEDNSNVALFDFALSSSDNYAQGGEFASVPISWLLVRPSEVPIPAAGWLFMSALVGLAGIKRKK